MDKAQFNEALNELQTLLDMVRWGMSRFNEANLIYGHGTDNAWDEALALALHVLHLSHDMDKTILNARLTSHERRKILELFSLRINKRLPSAYITHEAWFAGMSFYVDQRVIIPRSPIAELIENQFSTWIDPEKVRRILDVCTGSGCIAIACALYFPTAEIDAVEISDDALAVAKINVARHEVGSRLHLIKSDLFAKVHGQYDIIVANPPYVRENTFAKIPQEYRHEPRLALVGGEEGLDVVKKILKQATKYLTNQGILVVEVGENAEELMRDYPELPFIWLEFERGGDGVFLITKDELERYQHLF